MSDLIVGLIVFKLEFSSQIYSHDDRWQSRMSGLIVGLIVFKLEFRSRIYWHLKSQNRMLDLKSLS